MRGRGGIIGGLAATLLLCGGARAEDLLSGSAGSVSLHTDAQAASGRARLGSTVSYAPTLGEGLSAKLDVDAHAGPSSDGLLWSNASTDAARTSADVAVRLRADWSSLKTAVFSLEAADRFVTQPVLPSVRGEATGAPSDLRRETTVKGAARLTPLGKLRLELSGRIRRFSDRLDLSGGGGGSAELRTQEDEGALHLVWTPTPKLQLDASSKLAEIRTAWEGSAFAEEGYASVQPALAATLKPAPAETLTLSLARAVDPLSPGAFLTLAQISPEAGAALRPDQEWRLSARWSLPVLAAGALQLGFEQAALESSTEVIRVAGAEDGAPGSIAGGSRRQAEVQLDLPLAPLGLGPEEGGLALKGRGVWRRSEIVDPLTGALRRRSGEAPYEADLALESAAPAMRLAWGVSTREKGPQSFFGLAQVSAVETAPSLNAFVEYRPEPFTVRLELNDLVGGDQRWTDAYYLDTRATGALERVVHREEGGPGFTLRLKRPI